MLPPNELKNKNFTKAVRGYSMADVDEHIDFLIEKYTELYRENDELERRLRTTLAKLEAIKKDEESIRSALINAQRASSTIINEANERAEVVIRATKNNCDKILSDFRSDIRAECDRFLKLRASVAAFKQELFNMYNNHIEYIDTIGSDADEIDDLQVTEEYFVRQAIKEIKDDLTAVSENTPGEQEQPEIQSKIQTESDQNAPLIAEAKNKPVSEDFAPENISDINVDTDIEETETEIEPDKTDMISEDEAYEEYGEYEDTEETEDTEESDETELTEEYEETDEYEKTENKQTVFAASAEPVSKSTPKKASVKDTIRELNKIFNTADYADDNDTEHKTDNGDEDFGAEEFEDYNPVKTVAPENNDVKNDDESDESDEDREYNEFIRSIEEAAGRKTEKNNKKQKKNKPKPVSKDGNDFDFI
ncbi:MAG: DivIVA domain-containing protein [Eubacteriales bacterium]|nr:DivIVA domain-containing protein [Eubacteriales bacterium]